MWRIPTRLYLQSCRILAGLCLVVYFLAALSCVSVWADAGKNDLKNILFINSYGYDFETVPVVINEVSKRMKGIASIQYLFMNEKYISDDEASKQLSVELDKLTAEFSYDAVILGDDAAFDYAIENRDKYFRGIPLIYENINSIEKAEKYKNDPLISGVVEAFPIKMTLTLAQQIQKDAKRVVIITDNSISGAGSAGQVLALRADFPELAFEVFDTSKMNADEIQKKIASYGSETILLYTVFNVDGAGKRYTLAGGVRLVTSAAKIPVFKADEAGLGDGLVGGYMLSYKSIGQVTADLVIAALNGKHPESVPYRVGLGVYEFDQAVLTRYQIASSLLPDDAVYINKPQSFHERYAAFLLGAVCCVTVFFALFLVLVEQKRRYLRHQLKLEETANRAKTEFISKMSHDMRTPLNAVLGMTSLALQSSDDPVLVRDFLSKAASSGALLNALINDILDIAKIESGKMKLVPTPYSLDEFFANAQSIFEPMCLAKGINFQIRQDAKGRAVLTDAVRFNQIFYNILTNAVKFTSRDGTITLALASRVHDATLLACTFTISDTGCGISPEFQKKMFQQFSQERPNAAQGSGLGLSIVKNIVDMMKGSIQVESGSGKGTSFSIALDLPLTEPEARQKVAAEAAQTAMQRFAGLHVLLAEDNDINAEITEHMLEHLGLVADRAKDGEEAARMFSRSADGYYSCILMDNRMPVLTGIEATQKIRGMQTPGARKIPIIALTADAFDDDFRRFVDCGMNDCLVKPFNMQQLIAVLTRHVAQD